MLDVKFLRENTELVRRKMLERGQEIDFAPFVNSEKRRHAFSELQVQIQEQAPWIFLWSQFDIYGVNKKLQWEPRGDEQFAVGAAADEVAEAVRLHEGNDAANRRDRDV